MLELLLILICILPISAFIILNFFKDFHEKQISNIAIATNIIQGLCILFFIGTWIRAGHESINIKEWSLYRSEHFVFFIDFYFDKTTAVFLFLGNMISLVILHYSSFYMHKEKGYKRFFVLIMLFYSGYVYTTLAGSLENVFVGWEVLGISSFLLIAFYRNRYLPVKHAVRVFSIYRIGDVGILIAIWSSHHLWHENITFSQLNNATLVNNQLTAQTWVGYWFSIGLVLAAWVKSAQWPFSSWLPRAMEGPTPSSAVFYGSLSVHFGVFLLIRSFPLWEFQIPIRLLIGIMGGITAILAHLIARVQPTIKTQIAYASIAQIGLIFIELALGFIDLVLIHIIGNALLRTYQLLISPSIVAYRIKEQLYLSNQEKETKPNTFFKKFYHRYYMYFLMELHLDSHLSRWIFNPLKNLGRSIQFLKKPNTFKIFALYWSIAIVLFISQINQLHFFNHLVFPHLLSGIAFLLALKAFSERENALWSIGFILTGHVFMVAAISMNEKVQLQESFYYLSGIVLGALISFMVLYRLKYKQRLELHLYNYQGLSVLYPNKTNLFLLGILCMMGFPITPSVIGEDLLFSHIHKNQILLTLFYSISYILSGITLIRVYARIFMGKNPEPFTPTNKLTS